MFVSHEVSKEGQYLTYISNSGKIEPVIVDDKIPVENNGDGLFIVEPFNHNLSREAVVVPRNKRLGSPSQRSQVQEVEIWPQVLAKSLAKILGCYERLLKQEISNCLSDLTGMPVKTISSSKIEFKWLRENYKKRSIMICVANKSWISQRRRDCSIQSGDEDLNYWIINQVLRLSDDKLMIEVKNHYCDKTPKLGSTYLYRLEY